MGGGNWDDNLYATKVAQRQQTGTDAFDHSRKVLSGEVTAKVHPDLDPRLISPRGRESCDSVEHPDSRAMAVLFDVTGSMSTTPRVMQQKLVALMNQVKQQGGLPDVQLLFGAIGDWFCDHFPFQAGQFESDNRCDDQLGQMILESGGGGNGGESYHLAFYFAARKTSIDCFTRRGKKGYLFTIGDEPHFDRIRVDEAKEVFGDDIPGDIPIAALVAEMRTRWEHYHLIPKDTSNGKDPEVLEQWQELLGVDRVIPMQTAADISEVTSGLVALRETGQTVEAIADLFGLTGATRRNVIASLQVAQ